MSPLRSLQQPSTSTSNGRLTARTYLSFNTFCHTGLDYCGPITTKTVKIYVAIFICFSTKAFHLEPVNSLTKEACISTLHRFFARRGPPIAIYSDNSRTFTGTHAELEKQRMLAEQKINESLEPLTA